jgi:hypothetical protein
MTDTLYTRYPTTAAKGRQGEAWMLQQLQKIYAVQDYTQDMQMQANGIDFGIMRDGWQRARYIDIKHNVWSTPHNTMVFAIEIARADGAPGWFLTSRADRIYHCNTRLGIYTYYDLPTMRQWIVQRALQQQCHAWNSHGCQLITVTIDACPLLATRRVT